MASTLTAAVDPAVSPVAARRLPRWMREPLVHFCLLGAAIFAIDHLLVSRLDDPNAIVIGAAADREARQTFRAARGREPDADELRALRRVWLDNEVLYREGIALQLDRGDPAIRERVIFKALSMIDAGTRVPPYDDASLRRWFEAHRDRYDEPARVTFDEAVLEGTPTEADVRAFVAQLRAGTRGDARAGLRVFKDRPVPTIVAGYGADFAKSLETAPVDAWQALPAQGQWRAIRVDAVAPPRPAEYERLRGVVLHDWTDAVMAEQRSAAVGALAKKYKVRVEDAPAR